MLENFKSWKVVIVFIWTIVVIALFFSFFHKTDEEKAKEILEQKDKVRTENIQKNIDELSQKKIDLQIWQDSKKELEKTLESVNKNIDELSWDVSELKRCNSMIHKYKWTYVYPVNCTKRENIPNLLSPDELFYTQKKSDKCYVSQPEDDHYHKWAGAVLATDVACGFKAEVYSPDYLSEVIDYRVEIKKDPLLWNYAELYFLDRLVEKKWIIWHLKTRLKTGDIIRTGVRIWEHDLSWATTGYHSHIELWEKVWKEWKNISYTTRSKVLHNSRNWIFETPKENKIYFTTYDLWDLWQNAGDACVGASWVRQCTCFDEKWNEKVCTKKDDPTMEARWPILEWFQTVALTVDMRKKLWVKFWDNVELTWNNWKKFTVQVHDEMNKRYRTSCIKNSGFCIKWDIARFKWKADLPSWVYFIKKL